MDIAAFDDSFDGLMSPEAWSQVAIAAELTSRERAVCQLLFQGKTRQEIAQCLSISPRTVRQHLEQLHGKLAVKNRVGLVLRVIQIRDALRSAPGERPVSSNGRHDHKPANRPVPPDLIGQETEQSEFEK